MSSIVTVTNRYLNSMKSSVVIKSYEESKDDRLCS